MVNCTVTPMDTAYAELAVNVPVSIPGGCSVPDTGSCSIPGAEGSDLMNNLHGGEQIVHTVELPSTSGINFSFWFVLKRQ